MLRWLWFHVHDRLDARLTGPTLEAAGLGLLASAHDCSDGGLAVALAEKGLRSADALPVEAYNRLVVQMAVLYKLLRT